MQALGAAAAFTQFFLYGRRHFTRTGYERARAAILAKGADPLDTADVAGRVFVVTGANSGVGKEVSLYLAKRGATVNMICRSAARGESARRQIVEASGNERVYLRVCDVSLEDDVRKTWSETASTASCATRVCC
jgi:NADP-dependent 3-hydroxy acid dehydrogenase YdfG